MFILKMRGAFNIVAVFRGCFKSCHYKLRGTKLEAI